MTVAPKNLVLDVSAILELWFAGENEAQLRKLIKEANARGAILWVATTSLALLQKNAAERLSEVALSPSEASRKLLELITQLLGQVRILSNYGFDQVELLKTSRNFADAQIVASARSLAGASVRIVTTAPDFDSLEEIAAVSPTQALDWLQKETWNDDQRSLPFIDLSTQQVTLRQSIERNIETVLRHGQYIMGPEVKALEERLSSYVGVKHCITASSGTDTLLIAMMALGVGAGDEVITTPFTFIATAEMIALLGAKPVFVDIEPRTFNIDPAKIEAAITPKTKAIMPVSLYGQCADFDAINAIAAKYNLPVIEDAAQSFGATYKGRRSCALSTVGSTSFFPSKPLGGYGDGGALFTDDDALAKTMREIRLHGQDRRYHHPMIGINGRIDTLQAAVVLAKMEVFEKEVNWRAEIGARYTMMLEKHAGSRLLATPYIEPHNTSVYAQYTLRVKDRDLLQKKLNESGIPTAIHYPIPLHLQPVFSALNYSDGSFPVAEKAAKEVLSIPMHPYLSFAEADRAANIIRKSCD